MGRPGALELLKGPAMSRDRVPPSNLAAEEACLAALMISPVAIHAIRDCGLEAAHFLKPAHQAIFSSIVNLDREGVEVDVVTVAGRLNQLGELERSGGSQYLLELQNSTPAISNARRYAETIISTAQLRRLILAAGQIADLGYTSSL